MTSSGGIFDGDSPGLAVALTVRFLLELALLAGIAALAWHLAPGWWQWPVMIIAPILAAILWGLLLSPKAPATLPEPMKLVIETILFVGTGAGLFFVGLAVPAIIGVAAWIIDRIALALLQD